MAILGDNNLNSLSTHSINAANAAALQKIKNALSGQNPFASAHYSPTVTTTATAYSAPTTNNKTMAKASYEPKIDKKDRRPLKEVTQLPLLGWEGKKITMFFAESGYTVVGTIYDVVTEKYPPTGQFGSAYALSYPSHLLLVRVKFNLIDVDVMDHDGSTVHYDSHNMTVTSDVYSDSWYSFAEPNRKSKAKVVLTMDSVVMPEDKKDLIRAAVSQVEHTDKIFEEWGFGEVFEKGTAVSLLFYGVPGTGKTLMGQAIADELGRTFKMVSSGEIQSSEPGGAERAIKAFFEEAQKKNQVLMFDECDSLIADRNEVGMILGAQINALLTSLEHYTGIVIFTTNRLGRMDPAFERRVSAKIEFSFPDETQREAIWRRLVPEKAPLSKDVDFKALASYPIAGGNIKNAVLNAARQAAFRKMDTIDMACFKAAIEKEVESLNGFQAAYEQQAKLPRLAGGRPDLGMGSGNLTVEQQSVSSDIMRRAEEKAKSKAKGAK